MDRTTDIVRIGQLKLADLRDRAEQACECTRELIEDSRLIAALLRRRLVELKRN
jgi:hypothetical protein